MSVLVTVLIALVIGIGIAAVAYPYGFPGIYLAAIVTGGVAFLFLGAEGDSAPTIAFIGFILGLFVVSRVAPLY